MRERSKAAFRDEFELLLHFHLKEVKEFVLEFPIHLPRKSFILKIMGIVQQMIKPG